MRTTPLSVLAFLALGSPCFSRSLNPCDPQDWVGYDGAWCGPCSGLVNVRDNGGTCEKFCAKQGLLCKNAWDDTTSEQCSPDAPKLGCSHEFRDTSDGICQCFKRKPSIPTTKCDPHKWKGFDGRQCGECSALVKVRKNGKTCDKYCREQDLSCVDAWDDTTNEQCSDDAPRLGCHHKFKDTSDAICKCTPASDICFCAAVYDPVCGTDGKTYSNKCQAACAKVSVSYDGECKNPTGKYPACAVHSDCANNQFCGIECWTGDCGQNGKVPKFTAGKYCQPCNECEVASDSVTGNCNICRSKYPACAVHSDCANNQFCGTECWTGDCGLDGKVPKFTAGKYCQPCNECEVADDSVTGNCNVCAGTCNPSTWKGYDGRTCDKCSALVKISDFPDRWTGLGTCMAFCAAQNMPCVDGWDDTTNNQCSPDAPKLGCVHGFKDTSDAICQCKQCDPSTWKGYDGRTCGTCSALVEVRKHGKTCEKYCEKQGLYCIDAWDDTTSEQCSPDAPRLGCQHKFKDTSDAICECRQIVLYPRRRLRGVDNQ